MRTFEEHGRGMSVVGTLDERVVRAVREGLRGPVKFLPGWHLQDADGARLLARLALQPTWYPARAEAFVLDTHTDAILEAAGVDAPGKRPRGAPPARVDVVELGPCVANRSRPVLAALTRRWAVVRYVPLDGPEAGAPRLHRLARELPGLDVRPRRLFAVPGGLAGLGKEAEARVVLLLGGLLGRMSGVEARALLSEARTCAGGDGAVLLGLDHTRDKDALRAAYADPEGIVAALNRNVLLAVNRALGARFDACATRHVARWCPARGRVELALAATRAQSVPVEGLGVRVTIGAGEQIRTGGCTQYALPKLDELLASAALARVATWFDPTERYAVHVARPR